MARQTETPCCISLLNAVLILIFAPIFLALYLVFIAFWLVFTLTGIGPVLQILFNNKDCACTNLDHLIEKNGDIMRITVPGDVHSCSQGKPYTLVARFTEPAPTAEVKRGAHPVCIPNGLGATMVTISILHEELVRRGFTVLSFDRLGVGFSDANTSCQSPTAEDVVKEMHFVMQTVLTASNAAATRWVLIGPSMGSIVGQCYAAEHPDSVAGFLNMDGLPYPFVQFRSRFEMAAKLYKIYPYIIWTGILRPFIALAFRNPKLRWVVSGAFNMDVVTAQLNDARFFSNIGLEMITMMHCAAFAAAAWGPLSIVPVIEAKEGGAGAVPAEAGELLSVLAGAPPDESIEVDEMTPGKERRLPTDFVSQSEVAEEWRDASAVQEAVQKVRTYESSQGQSGAAVAATETNELHKGLIEGSSVGGSSGRLAQIWKQLVVRVMSGRSHDYGNPIANSFYTDSMKDYAAIEHAMHALLAKNGSRTVYPHLSHMQMFSQCQEIVKYTIEIADALANEKA
jgi:pimeloyl-ACP methyl ester carboxylesterase